VSHEIGPEGVLLISGGFDSPVAGHLMAQQGFRLTAAHFSLEPITDDGSSIKARKLVALLGLPTLYVLRVGEAFAEVAHACNRRFYFVLTKRLMVRLADAIADRESATCLVTGENLGQVSSQTLANLRAIDAVARRPVVRPLIGMDKQEIVDRARAIGTYEISKGPEICDLLGPPRPATQSRLEQIAAEEVRLDIEGLVAACMEHARPERFKQDGPPHIGLPRGEPAR
jgi:tRNA uracil 4-sulfurtransferase